MKLDEQGSKEDLRRGGEIWSDYTVWNSQRINKNLKSKKINQIHFKWSRNFDYIGTPSTVEKSIDCLVQGFQISFVRGN